MKTFFEEYGLVLVVILVVSGMLIVADQIPTVFGEKITSAWEEIGPSDQ